MTVNPVFFSKKMAEYWEKLGNFPTPALKLAWEQMAHTFNAHIEGENTEKWTILQLPTGAGKTRGLALYCSMLSAENPPGAAIITRLTEEAKSLEETINSLAGKKIAIADYHEHRHDDYHIHHAPILIVTHNAYLDAMDVVIEAGMPGFRWADFVEWSYGDRRLSVIDESLDFIKSSQFSLSQLREIRSIIPERIIAHHVEKIVTLEQAIKKFSALADLKDTKAKQRAEAVYSDFWNISHPEHIRQLYWEIRYLPFDTLLLGYKDREKRDNIRRAYRAILESAAEIISSWGLYSKKWGEHLFTKASFAMPLDWKNTIILDATASQNPMYDYLGSSKKKLKIPTPVRNYANVTLNAYFNHPVGKAHLQENIKTLAPSLMRFLSKEIGKNRKVFFCVHKATEPYLEKYKKRLGNDTAFGHWYALDGRNDWQDCDTIVIYGLPYLDSSLPLASVLALLNLKKNSAKPILTEEVRRQASVYERQLRIVKLVQAINRIRCRRTIDEQGNCEEAAVYLFLNKQDDGERLLRGIAQEMPGIRIERFYDALNAKEQKDRSPLGKEIFKRLKRNPPGKYPAKELLNKTIKKTGKGSLAALRQFIRRCNDNKSPAAKQMRKLGVKYVASKKGGRGNMGVFVKS